VIVRSSKFLLILFAAIFLGGVLVVTFSLWRLSKGPVSVNFITPYIEESLSRQTKNIDVRLKHTVLTWAGLERDIDLRALDLTIFDKEGAAIATVPELSLQLSLRALLRGVVAPKELEIFEPRLQIKRARSGQVAIGINKISSETKTEFSDVGWLADFFHKRGADSNSNYLRRLTINNALVEFEDLKSGYKWKTQPTDINLESINNSINLTSRSILIFDSGVSEIKISAIKNPNQDLTDVIFSFENLSPEMLATLDPRLNNLKRLKVPVSGSLSMSIRDTLDIENITFDLSGGKGEILAKEFFIDPLSVHNFLFRGEVDGSFNKLLVDRALINFNGPIAEISGDVIRLDSSIKMKLNGRLAELSMNRVADLWPESVASISRKWIIRNIKDGFIDTATFSLNALTDLEDLEDISISKAQGELELKEAYVHYLRPMKPLKLSKSKGYYDGKKLIFDIDNGSIGNIEIVSGELKIDDLRVGSEKQSLSIEATILGPLDEVISILDNDPLNLVSSTGIKSGETTGFQKTKIHIGFPLINELSLDDISFSSSSQLNNVKSNLGLFNLDIYNSDVIVNIDKKRLSAKGKGLIEGVPANFLWEENFLNDATLRSSYVIDTIIDEEIREKIGLQLNPFIEGPINAGVTYEVSSDGSEVLNANFDLTDSTINLQQLGWKKLSGSMSQATFMVSKDQNWINNSSRFTVIAPGLFSKGNISFRTEGVKPVLSQIDFKEVKIGESDLSIQISLEEHQIPKVTMSGKNLDLRRLASKVFFDDENNIPPVQIFFDERNPLKAVRLGEESILLKPIGQITNDGDKWTRVDLIGVLSNGGNVSLNLHTENQKRKVKIKTDNGGALLNSLDWINTIHGGEFNLVGEFTDRSSETQFVGISSIKNFKLNESSAGVRILSLASLSGLSDAVTGTGISMRRAEVPFEVNKEKIKILGAKARGANVGVIASGYIGRKSEAVALKGEIAPANVINSILANIPVINKIIGDGIIAVTYDVDGTLEEPKVTVNPLTVFVPGIFRKAFKEFDNENSDKGSSSAPQNSISK